MKEKKRNFKKESTFFFFILFILICKRVFYFFRAVANRHPYSFEINYFTEVANHNSKTYVIFSIFPFRVKKKKTKQK